MGSSNHRSFRAAVVAHRTCWRPGPGRVDTRFGSSPVRGHRTRAPGPGRGPGSIGSANSRRKSVPCAGSVRSARHCRPRRIEFAGQVRGPPSAVRVSPTATSRVTTPAPGRASSILRPSAPAPAPATAGRDPSTTAALGIGTAYQVWLSWTRRSTGGRTPRLEMPMVRAIDLRHKGGHGGLSHPGRWDRTQLVQDDPRH